jgi:hypothetical protein
MSIKKGDKVLARDYKGEWHEAIADSAVEDTHVVDYNKVPARTRKIHDFPVVWVWFRRGEGNRVPWPAEDVKRSEKP